MKFPIFSGKYSLRNRSSLPDQSGIYFVIDNQNQILYIGQAKSLRSRWTGKSHHRYKQFARKGLDKIFLCYIEASASELDTLEKNYINQFKPPLNDTKVKQYLPKKSPKLSDLQRLLKATNSPLFPSVQYRGTEYGKVLREDWDLIRGFIAGIDQTHEIPQIIIVCKQNLGTLLWERVRHRTKKRFCSYNLETGCYEFNLTSLVVIFAELFSQELSDPVFQAVYPDLVEGKHFGVTVQRLTNFTSLNQALNTVQTRAATKDYLIRVSDNLQLVPEDFQINEEKTW